MGDPCGDAFDVDASTGALPADGDADGMADAWEATHGLDSGKDDSTGLTVGLGRGIADLTNVEVYLHDLHLQRIGAAP